MATMKAPELFSTSFTLARHPAPLYIMGGKPVGERTPRFYVVYVSISGLDDADQNIADEIYKVQIERYVGSVENVKTWKDWTELSQLDQPLPDFCAIFGDEVFYRARYMDSAGTIYGWSDWSSLLVE